EPVAWASAIAASLAEIVSSAVNRSETLYECPASSPTMFGDTVVACLLATTMAFGLSAGMSEIAVSTLSVLAGRYQPCGSLAASTWPVPASATIHAEALIFGSRGTEPDEKLTSTPRPESWAPPIAAGDTGAGRAEEGVADAGGDGDA